MLHANLGQWKILTGRSSLDHLANNIASATFDVINAGKVRTADMGGESSFILLITKRGG